MILQLLMWNFRHTGQYRPIRDYGSVSIRYIHEGFFAKLAQFIHRESKL